ncbi:hypothetical protein Hanom_Chr01g00000981 [Helianthus anomalus]
MGLWLLAGTLGLSVADCPAYKSGGLPRQRSISIIPFTLHISLLSLFLISHVLREIYRILILRSSR